MPDMQAYLVETRGDANQIVSRTIPAPSQAEGNDLLIEVKATSVNPVDIKVRAGTYDDYPTYFSRAPLPQILGFDGAGVVLSTGPAVRSFKAGDEVYYAGSPTRHGSNAERTLVDAGAAALKPSSLGWAAAAALPLTYITAHEALVERLGIGAGERAGLLVVNGGGGVGSVAVQIAARVLRLPAVVATAGRDETRGFAREMGASAVVDHRGDVVAQVRGLGLDVPLKYAFVCSRTEQYLAPVAELLEPFGRVCSIVQTRDMGRMYGTEFMAKSLTFSWELLGTKPWYGVDTESHGRMLEELRGFVEEGKIKSHMTKKMKLDLEGLREAHRIVEDKGMMGKLALEME